MVIVKKKLLFLNTLSSSASADDDDFVGASTNKSKYNVKFANNSSSSKLVAIKDGNYKISFGLVNADKTKAATVTNPSAHEEDATELERLIYVKNAISSVVYADILENVDLEYVVNGKMSILCLPLVSRINGFFHFWGI